MTALAVVAAVVAAVCFAVGGILQHRAVAAEVVPGPSARSTGAARLGAEGFAALLRCPGWLLGLGLAGAGATLHALALVVAPVSVIQPVGVLAVPIAVLLAARATGTRPSAAVGAAVGLAVGGVAGFVALAAGSAVSGAADPTMLAIAGAGVGIVVLGLAAVAARAGSPIVRCLACAAGGATAFGLVSALVRALAERVAAGAAVLDVAGLAGAIAVALLAGGWLVQQAFAAGPAELVVATLTVVDPVVAVGLGIALLGEGAATGLPTALAMAGCAVVAAVGVLALARHHPDALRRREQARAVDHDDRLVRS
ncbi:hypothetical protein PSU4_22320 [Pseudonocardia sulfidoxydans NBRC 16205]|uniref:Integral membrane protein n=1 Tax=Pseudonocardia sulfidoxydans NBRC 16205 TaxID=1223511 RepID=A0A511DJR6_9PSEU|nr:hypothetical protein [Pseudonocardia sulfidoxydans]GEL23278.1 hypothetical protein PSU4_22320 [Pseudonocardia sulfidoxydans NBRC 16205]